MALDAPQRLSPLCRAEAQCGPGVVDGYLADRLHALVGQGRDEPITVEICAELAVAAVIAALLDHPETRHRTLELTGGQTPLDAAVRSIS
jgi:uncharacterized protein YbjT (DUF2867 family)